jgi:hypothetical protein
MLKMLVNTALRPEHIYIQNKKTVSSHCTQKIVMLMDAAHAAAAARKKGTFQGKAL